MVSCLYNLWHVAFSSVCILCRFLTFFYKFKQVLLYSGWINLTICYKRKWILNSQTFNDNCQHIKPTQPTRLHACHIIAFAYNATSRLFDLFLFLCCKFDLHEVPNFICVYLCIILKQKQIKLKHLNSKIWNTWFVTCMWPLTNIRKPWTCKCVDKSLKYEWQISGCFK